jgi:hypothetical protein
MKNLLNYLPSWKTTKMFLNILYYVGFIFWFLSRIFVIVFKPVENHFVHVINNDDIFIALIFITFFILDIKETIVNRRN